MAIDVESALKGLKQMTITQLRERYAEVWGEPTRSFNKPHLVKRIIWRLQALEEGDLSERARRRARELANDADLRIRPPPVSTVPDNGGQRNDALYAAVHNMIGVGIAIDEAERLALQGALACGLTQREAQATIQSALRAKRVS